MTSRSIRIATRKSQLALWQAEHVRARLQQAHPGIEVELETFTTQGDRILDAPLAKIGGKGLFVKELEQSLLRGDSDIAVHSMKDVPVLLPEGLQIAAVLARENPHDAFVSNQYQRLDDLPKGSRVGTSSLRRRCQLAELRPDLQISDLRGNVNTRLAKLDDDQYDAIILACAGLIRLDMADRIREAIAATVMLPAIGQGTVGIECRADDAELLALLEPLHDNHTASCIDAERAMNLRLEGGCQVPIGGHAVIEHGVMVVRGLVGRPDGTDIINAVISGRPEDAQELGSVLAEDLLSRGAGEILREVYAQQ
ncbi:MAG TPA: hydroxymethylbilane synthase [Gammaproteobacteria bacterium]|nr:hydroxymethylbilane synthase [Gammaproteobacteria bacterium]